MNRPSILRISQGSFRKSIEQRNALNRVLEMDLDGFFARAFLAFFRADEDSRIEVGPAHSVLDCAFNGRNRRHQALRAEMEFLRWASTFIKKEGVAVIQANDPYLSGLNALLLSRITGVPYVIELVSDYDLSYEVAGKRAMPILPSRSYEKKIERLVLRSAHRVCAWNRYYLNYGLRNGAKGSRCAVIPGVTDPFFYQAEASRPIEELLDKTAKQVLLYVGRLSGEKYPLDLVEAVHLLRSNGYDCMLAIAGDGEQRPLLDDRARRLGVSDYVSFVGHCGAQDIVDLQRGSDVILATHAGYALIEAALSATPIVAYDYEWHPELIRHDVTGLLATYRSSSALAMQVTRILEDPHWGASLGQAAREFALEFHSPERAREAERSLYKSLM